MLEERKEYQLSNKIQKLKKAKNYANLNFSRAGRPVFFWNRFIEPVPLANRFIGTGSNKPVQKWNRFKN